MKEAKWIDAYDENKNPMDNRIDNLMWTISGDYADTIDSGEMSFISKNVALYYAVTAGARRKYIEWPIVKKYIINRQRAGFDKDILLGLIAMGSDHIVEQKIIAERPGIYDIRKKAYDDILGNYYKLHTVNLIEKTRYAMIQKKTGKSPLMDLDTRHLLNDLLGLQTRENTIELLRGIEEIYVKCFPVFVQANGKKEKKAPESTGKSGDFSDFMMEELSEEPSSSDNEVSVDDILNSWTFGNGILQVKDEESEKTYGKVAYYYGKSILSINEIKQLQNQVCQGIHGSCRIHMTDGIVRSDTENDCQEKYIRRQLKNNMAEFQANVKVFRQSINRLRDSMARTLVQEEIADRIPSDTGKIVANKLWRINRSMNNKVFVKTIDNNKGNFVMDILIDSSGSQRMKQSRVAIQAYILAQALTLLGIPNRVLGFSSFLEYTVIKRFRDYESPVTVNDNIFEYFCSGNNRDGLAIKATCQDLMKRREDNKVLIVLSDGRPNDIKIGKGQVEDLQTAYRGQVAIEDTAREVHLARQQGILILGVFTGSEQDLMAEKLIYGKDFAYIKHINRFSEMVIKYIKQIIMY